MRKFSSIRSYVMKDGHLFLALMADGGIYEFEPLASAGKAAGTGDMRTRALIDGLVSRTLIVRRFI